MGFDPMSGEQQRVIRTPDQRLRVFVSSTLKEMAEEREAARQAIESLRLSPILFELGARPHPAQDLYRAYLAQSHIFIGLYWQQYGWIAPDMEISGLEDEYRLAAALPKLIYIKSPAPNREPVLNQLLRDIKNDSGVSYKYFSTSEDLRELIANDLALLLTERFEQSGWPGRIAGPGKEGNAKQRQRAGLPALPTALIGRGEELEQLCALLLDDEARLVTLTGPGGVGKTSLALAAAAEVADVFEGNVYWTPLATIDDADLVISAVAKALDVSERAGTSLLESVKGYLQERRALLVLDNFEQVLDAAPVIGELLAASAGLTVLATSRAALQIRAERELVLPPLALPAETELSVERAGKNPAVALYVERARAASGSFELHADNVAAVSEIVRRLDGLPLAIELAAARSKLLSAQGILERLASRLSLLTGGARDLPVRQQTLRNAIGWSYELLDEELKRLFRRLSVFAGGFTLESAEGVCGADDGSDVMGGVQALLDHSLLRIEPSVRRERRYIMLQTIREFALEALEASGEATKIEERHANVFAALVEEAWPKMFSGAGEEWLDRLEADYGNVRKALEWHEGQRDFVVSHKMIVYLVWFWYRRAYLDEGRLWYERALAQEVTDGDEAIEALLVGHAGSVAMWQSDFVTAQRLLDEGIELMRPLGERIELGDVLFTRGALAVNQGDDERAVAVLEEAHGIMQRIGQSWFEAMIFLHLGNVALNRGDVEDARRLMQKALERGRQVGDRWVVASAINNLGEIARHEQQLDEAEGYYEESLALFRSVGSTPDVARAYHSLAYVAIWRGDYPAAARLLQQSLGLYRQVGVKRGVVEGVNAVAALAATTGDREAARRLALAAQEGFRSLGAGIWPADRRDVEQILAETGVRIDDVVGQAVGLETALQEARQLLENVTERDVVARSGAGHSEYR